MSLDQKARLRRIDRAERREWHVVQRPVRCKDELMLIRQHRCHGANHEPMQLVAQTQAFAHGNGTEAAQRGMQSKCRLRDSRCRPQLNHLKLLARGDPCGGLVSAEPILDDGGVRRNRLQIDGLVRPCSALRISACVLRGGRTDLRIDLVELLPQTCNLIAQQTHPRVLRTRSVEPDFELEAAGRELSI